ncbi:MAG: DUF927 domain-containing protein [Sulfurimicrobium sp.]|nr:DUF927 domain-containing protein [Sulfurimicrobium sp.]
MKNIQLPVNPVTADAEDSTSKYSSRISNVTSNVLNRNSIIPDSIHVIGITPEGSDTGREVILTIHSNGRNQNYHFPVAGLAFGEMTALATVLAETGHYNLVERKQLRLFAAAILEEASTHSAIVLTTQGSHKVVSNDGAYDCYVWGDEIYWLGPEPQARVVVSNFQKHVSASCSLEDWNNNVGKKLTGNSYLIVIHGHTLAAAIRRIFGQPLTSMSLIGQSSIGKSTLQQSAQSQIGSIDGVASMSGTKNGLLEYLLGRPDSPVFFQDIRQNDKAATFFELVFDAADGAGRMRSGDKVQIKNGATMILSNERLAVDMGPKNKVPIDEGLYACHGSPHRSQTMIA